MDKFLLGQNFAFLMIENQKYELFVEVYSKIARRHGTPAEPTVMFYT